MGTRFVAARIKTAREERGISQKKLGMILGLSDKAISAYEAGRTYPPLDTLFKLSRELSKPVNYFIEEDNGEASLIDSIAKISEKIASISVEIEKLKRGLKKNN
ncbi:helix-turn-helix transcriptional regulator [Candidatus Dojkabacteria bacterium]|nr:helix-turn-helix transcriptional regulator [Candidatus Dojkabacteria bacterium]